MDDFSLDSYSNQICDSKPSNTHVTRHPKAHDNLDDIIGLGVA